MTSTPSCPFLVLLVLYQIFCVVSIQQCRNEYSIYGMMLKRHVFKKTKASNWRDCIHACEVDLRCQSMNYVISRDMCELNNHTKEARPEDFVPNEKRSYMKRFSKIVPLGSAPEVPATSCAQIKASEGDNAASGSYWLNSIKPGESVMVPCNMLIEECISYQVLIGVHRKDRNLRQPPSKNDGSLGPGWFRFLGNAGTKMATSCVPYLRCGTDSTGWMDGSHPEVADGKVTRVVCFSWDGNCCKWSINIQLRNCDGYFVYYIDGTPYKKGSLGYCSSD